MAEPTVEKKSLRAELRRRLRSIDAATRRERSSAAAARLIETDEFRGARVVMIFLPLASEIAPRSIALRAWQEAKLVAVPLVSYEQRHMLPVELRGLEEPMHTDGRGVRTPRRGEPQPIESVDLVITPGLGFDRLGRRIGRGAGFYDRFLAQPAFRGVSCGLAMHEQVVEAVPTQRHDVRLDMLATDERVLRFHRERA